LSQTSTAPYRLREYVHKCFSGMASLALSADGQQLLAFISSQGEKVFLHRQVNLQVRNKWGCLLLIP